MKSSEKKHNIKKEGNGTSSDSEDSDSFSDNSSSDTLKKNRKTQKALPQFSVLRSESDGLRMKISAIRSMQDIPLDKKKTSSNNNNNNNNNDIAVGKTETSRRKKSKSRVSSSGSSSSCCSVCSRTDTDGSSSESQQEKSRKIRIKRKKAQLVSAPIDRKPQGQTFPTNSTWSSDKKNVKISNRKTSVEPTATASIKKHPIQTNEALPNDCLSSSDTELPALVNAAIKCVESSSEVENSAADPPLQYTSALLHDFMIKTQMLGSCTEIATLKRKSVSNDGKDVDSVKKIVSVENSSTDKKCLDMQNENKKKRGRPKKQSGVKSNHKTIVNESLDSGITSTAQSLSPSPNSPGVKEISNNEKGRESRPISNGVLEYKEPMMPKISITNLEKQIYATERILYPPRGRKKSVGKTRSKVLKCDVDPIWKKIDVNTKFHRPILAGYKSDGGSTVCSKRRASKGGYVSDFGTSMNKSYSGYKSDRSGKSRCSMKSFASRAKSCDYRSDYSNRSRKIRRKKRAHVVKHSKSFTSVNEQDILQLAGLSLGQTSEESSRESLDKPIEASCSSKKYGEINRFIRTGEYFGGGKRLLDKFKFGGSQSHMSPIEKLEKSIFRTTGIFSNKLYLKAMKSVPLPSKDLSHDGERFSSKLRSRRSSAISRCSSMSMNSKYNIKRRRRRKLRARSQSRFSCIDPKFHIQIEILVNSFSSLCRIDGDSSNKISNTKDKIEKEKNSNNKISMKRNIKKRKLSENLEHFQSGNIKRRHKKSGQNSPDEHKLPLKKRHYLLMPGEKCDSKSMHLLEVKSKELSEVKYSSKSSANVNLKVPSKAVTPKKRHLLETPQNVDISNMSHTKYSSSSSCNDFKPILNSPERINDIMSQKLLNQVKNDIIKKKNRLEGLVSKMQSICGGIPSVETLAKEVTKKSEESVPSVFPPPGVFEPSVELEIQIPLTKLSTSNIVTKSEVDSPKILPESIDYERPFAEPKTERVVETLLNKTGGHFLMKKKRRKVFNRTGFPTVKKRKRKLPIDSKFNVQDYEIKNIVIATNLNKSKQYKISGHKTEATPCDRVPHIGETSATFLERNKQPRLSVVSLDRLQDPNKKHDVLEIKQKLNLCDDEKNIKERSENTTRSRASTGKNRKETPTLSVGNEFNFAVENKPIVGEVMQVEENKSEVLIDSENQKICNKIILRRHTNSMQLQALPKNDVENTKEKNITNIENKQEILINNENIINTLKSRLRQRKTLRITERSNRMNNKHKITKTLKSSASIQKPVIKRELKIIIPYKSEKKKNDDIGNSIVDDIANKKPKIENVLNIKKIKPLNKIIKLEKTPECISDESLEQEPLPLSEGVHPETPELIELNEICTKNKKVAKWKKSYLTAGLLSDSFKLDKQKRNIKEKMEKCNEEIANCQTNVMLPPPPYCEKFFRRTVYDFLLPFDIWWAHTNSKLPARVTVPSWNYRKIRTNVYGDVRPNPVVDHQICNCKSQSACGDDCLNRMVYTECSPAYCPCGDKCQNTKIQKHETVPGIERFMTENKGWGVRTSRSIKKGTYILEYVGEVVTEKEFKERMATLYVNDTHHYCLHLDGGLVIDGHRMGSDGRFVNHSCSPNCEMQKWSVNGLFRMALFALRNIEPGEELTYDYNFSLFNPSEGQPCRCETPQCRGVIGGKSQRIKPIDHSKIIEPIVSNRHSRSRKRQAKKNSGRFQSKDVIVPQFQLPSDREKKIIKGNNCFLIRNLEKVQKLKCRPLKNSEISPRPLTPSSIAAQISALRVPRNIKTRGLTQAATDPEVERMAKMAVILREICLELENIKDISGRTQISKLLPASRRKRNSQERIKKSIDFATVQTNVEKGLYKQADLFDDDINKVFSNAISHFGPKSEEASAADALSKAYTLKKYKVYDQLAKLVHKKSLRNFCPPHEKKLSINMKRTEDIIRCICGLFKDEGLMIQCARCLVWQHAECTKADTNAENYLCERCDNRVVDYEIPLNEFTEEGYRYYLSLLRGNLQIRQGDTVYVLRDIPIKDENGKTYATKKHTYETIGNVDYAECDIFRIERLWKNEDGKRFVFGHHYLRPHETFHEPTRKFYENEVIRVPLYEVVPIELIIARCWVLDRSTFCKGRPVDCTSEQHVYICELRVDKSARFFSKVKQSYPTCTKEYAFQTFPEKLKISRTVAPHDIDPSLIKSKKRRPEETTVQVQPRKNYPVIQLIPPPPKTMLEKRTRLECILKKLRARLPVAADTSSIDLSYLLTGRRARQRKANAASVPV